jgi:hypothetical protein
MNKIRKGWNTGFFTAPDAIYEVNYISGYAKSVYLYLCRCADSEGQSFPSKKTIAEKIGFSLSTVKRALAELEQFGFIAKEFRRKKNNEYDSNLYTIYHPSQIDTTGDEDVGGFSQNLGGFSQNLGGFSQNLGGFSQNHKGLHNKDYTIRTTQEGQQQQKVVSMKKETPLPDQNKEVSNKKSTRSNNNTTQNDVVVDPDPVISLLNQWEVQVNKKTVDGWRKKADDETILKVIRTALSKPDIENVVGYITAILGAGYTGNTPSKPEKKVKSAYLEKLRRAGAK